MVVLSLPSHRYRSVRAHKVLQRNESNRERLTELSRIVIFEKKYMLPKVKFFSNEECNHLVLGKCVEVFT